MPPLRCKVVHFPIRVTKRKLRRLLADGQRGRWTQCLGIGQAADGCVARVRSDNAVYDRGKHHEDRDGTTNSVDNRDATGEPAVTPRMMSFLHALRGATLGPGERSCMTGTLH